MEFKIIVAGIGPGAKEYVVPKALAAIEQAKVLVGGSRALNDFARTGQKTLAIKADISAVMDGGIDDFIESYLHFQKEA